MLSLNLKVKCPSLSSDSTKISSLSPQSRPEFFLKEPMTRSRHTSMLLPGNIAPLFTSAPFDILSGDQSLYSHLERHGPCGLGFLTRLLASESSDWAEVYSKHHSRIEFGATLRCAAMRAFIWLREWDF